MHSHILDPVRGGWGNAKQTWSMQTVHYVSSTRPDCVGLCIMTFRSENKHTHTHMSWTWYPYGITLLKLVWCACALQRGEGKAYVWCLKKTRSLFWGFVRVCLCVRLDWVLWLSPLPARQQATFINYWNRSVSRMRAKTGCLHLSLCFTASSYWFKAKALGFYPKAAEDQLIVASFIHLKFFMDDFSLPRYSR